MYFKIALASLTVYLLFAMTGCITGDFVNADVKQSTSTTNSLNLPSPTLTQTLPATPTKVVPTLTSTSTPFPLGNGELIAFGSQILNEYEVQEGFISVVNVNTRASTRLTSNDVIARLAAWSPEGGRIAYNVATDQGNEILNIMDANGSNNFVVNNDCSDPVWSPNGNSIACISGSRFPGYAIYIIDVISKKAKRVVEQTHGIISWSPDGQNIAYNLGMPGDEISNIFLLNVNENTQPTQLTSDLSRDSEPEWSPDGKYILFSSKRTGVNQIYIMNADGTHEYALTEGDRPNFDAKWSPDGTKIVFVSLRHEKTKCPLYKNPCNSEIYIMNADGSDQTRLTNSPGKDSSPVWSPDGKQIAFMSLHDEPNYKKCYNCNSEIYIMNIEDQKAIRLTNNQTYDFLPVWQPSP
jgi:Tol biopolymer transport system component